MQSTVDAVEGHIKHLLSARIEQAALIGGSYAVLWQNIEKIALSGGKRIRPLLATVGYGKLDDKILPIATAQELIHIAVLMHDDVIDRDFVRHNRPNVSGVYRDTYSRYLDPSEATHFANGSAVLAGDLLISEAYRMIHGAALPSAIKTKVVDQLALSIFEVIGGELMDIEATFIDDQPFDPLAIYRYKTAGYSFIGPLLSGAYCAELDDSTVQTLHDYAEAVGVAYQVQDDILGIFGDSWATGKSSITDLREAKQTILIKYHKEMMSSNRDMSRNFELLGQPAASNEALQAIASDIEESGAKHKAEQLALEYFTKAEEKLDQLGDDSRVEALKSLLERLRNRES